MTDQTSVAIGCLAQEVAAEDAWSLNLEVICHMIIRNISDADLWKTANLDAESAGEVFEGLR